MSPFTPLQNFCFITFPSELFFSFSHSLFWLMCCQGSPIKAFNHPTICLNTKQALPQAKISLSKFYSNFFTLIHFGWPLIMWICISPDWISEWSLREKLFNLLSREWGKNRTVKSINFLAKPHSDLMTPRPSKTIVCRGDRGSFLIAPFFSIHQSLRSRLKVSDSNQR